MSNPLIDFLTARLADDEAAVDGRRKIRPIEGHPCPRCGRPADGFATPLDNEAARITHPGGGRDCPVSAEEWREFADGGPVDDDRSRRALREVEAKRAITDEHTSANRHSDCCPRCMDGDDDPTLSPCPTLRRVAAVYADHPDYRQEWTP